MMTLADKAILSGADNRPPMLEKGMYDSWKSRMELYMMNRQHGRMILESIENSPLIWPIIEENGVTRPRKYSELTPADAIQADFDVKAINIILQGLPPEVYTLVSNHRIVKELWERIQLLMQGTSLTKQERECKLYDEFDEFAYKKGGHYITLSVSTILKKSSITYPSNDYQSSVHHNICSPPSSIPQMEYAHTVNQQQKQPEFPQLDSGLTVPVFKQGDDPIDAINHMMSFLSAVITSCYPTTNNQLRNSTYTPGASGSNSGKERTVICYNYKGEGHMSKQCTKPKRKRDDSWFKDKVLLVQAHANGQILHEQEQAFLANPIFTEGQATQTVITYNTDVLADVHNPDNMDNNMINQEQLKSQVMNCTKINLDNKSVNDTLTAELERYKEQVKVLKEGQNVDLKSQDNVSDSCEQSVEIDRLKQTLFEQLKERESLMQTVTLLKNDFKKEESRNIDREIVLKKKIKQLDNIVYKRDQPA
ncbi:hypothetical protein Tco_0503156 [Tanacetum coccineum]